METDDPRSGLTPDPATPPGAQHFPCTQCGGPLVFRPGTTHLQCPYCGRENDIPIEAEDDDHLTEHDYLDALEEEERRTADAGDAPAATAALCTYCGATTTVTERRTSDLCPYCGHPLAMQNLSSFRLNVQAVLPFQIDADKATAIYRQWVRSRWFAPNDFRRRATRGEAMRGIYMPYWTYDAVADARYTGRRGDAYYVTEMAPVTRNGRTTMEPRQVRRIRWTPVSGKVRVAFDDILVPASTSVPAAIQDGLQPWRMDRLQPFRREFLSGFVTETYQVPLKEGFDHAKTRMEGPIAQAIARDIGGDEQRIESKQIEYSDITFKHILLPVWMSAYAYGGTTYRFTINAQTGAVAGDRPYSAIKIALAVLAGLALLVAAYFAMGDGDGTAFGAERVGLYRHGGGEVAGQDGGVGLAEPLQQGEAIVLQRGGVGGGFKLPGPLGETAAGDLEFLGGGGGDAARPGDGRRVLAGVAEHGKGRHGGEDAVFPQPLGGLGR